MKNLIYIILLSAFTQSCHIDRQHSINADLEKTPPSEEPRGTTQAINSNRQGWKELRTFETKYQNNWVEHPEYFPYSHGELFKVYQLDCSGDCIYSPFKSRTSEGIEISKEDFNDLLEILSNPKSYNNTNAGCFAPKLGLVVYDDENVPTEFLSICLNCNNFVTYPGRIDIEFENEMLTGFSGNARNQLRNLFFKWGIDYYGYSSFWDDKGEYEKYLNR